MHVRTFGFECGPCQRRRARGWYHSLRTRHRDLESVRRHAGKAQPTMANPLAKGSTCVMQRDMMDFTNVSQIHVRARRIKTKKQDFRV